MGKLKRPVKPSIVPENIYKLRKILVFVAILLHVILPTAGGASSQQTAAWCLSFSHRLPIKGPADQAFQRCELF